MTGFYNYEALGELGSLQKPMARYRVGLPEVDGDEDRVRLEQGLEPVVPECLRNLFLKDACGHEAGAAGQSVKLLEKARLSARDT